VKILLIDDDADITYVASQLILKQVPSAALDIYNRPRQLLGSQIGSYDVVFCDYWMKGITGEEVMQTLQSHTKNFYIITGDKDVSLPHGTKVIYKPFSLNAFEFLKAS